MTERPDVAPAIPGDLRRIAIAARDLPPELSTALFLDETGRDGLARDIRAGGVAQILVLSTCDRLDLYLLDPRDGNAISPEIIGAVAARTGLPPARVEQGATFLKDRAAIEALFATASSLDSDTVGDPNILGQIKAAHREGRMARHIGPDLDALLQATYGAAKRVLSGTAIGRLPVSLASVAGSVARDIFGELASCRVLLIGGSEMGQTLARHFAGAGIALFACCDRDPARTAALAERFDAHIEPFDDIEDALARADIVIGATEDRRLVADAGRMRRVLKRRKRRPIFLIDVALPEDFDPAVERVDGVFRYDLGDLETVALENRATRALSASEARALIAEEVDAYLAAGSERRAVGVINDLRTYFEAERRAVLANVPQAGAEEATRLLINRLLHGPVSELRAMARADRLADGEGLVRALFGLTGDAESGDATGAEKKSK